MGGGRAVQDRSPSLILVARSFPKRRQYPDKESLKGERPSRLPRFPRALLLCGVPLQGPKD